MLSMVTLTLSRDCFRTFFSAVHLQSYADISSSLPLFCWNSKEKNSSSILPLISCWVSFFTLGKWNELCWSFQSLFSISLYTITFFFESFIGQYNPPVMCSFFNVWGYVDPTNAFLKLKRFAFLPKLRLSNILNKILGQNITFWIVCILFLHLIDEFSVLRSSDLRYAWDSLKALNIQGYFSEDAKVAWHWMVKVKFLIDLFANTGPVSLLYFLYLTYVIKS